MDLILLGYSNLVKECVVDIHNMLCISFSFFFFFFSNVLWVLNIGMYIDICKNQNNNCSEILHAHNVRQSLLHI